MNTLLLIAFLACVPNIQDARSRVQQVLDGLDPKAGGEPYQSAEKLQSFSRELVIELVDDRLNNDVRFLDPPLRQLTYSVLHQLRVETLPDGVNILIQGLKEGYGPGTLGLLGPNPPVEVLEALGSQVTRPPPLVQAQVIQSLAVYKQNSAPYFERLAEVYHQRESPVRGAAAKAMIEVGGFKRAWEELQKGDRDAATIEILLDVLARLAYQTNGSFEAGDPEQRIAKQYVLDHLKHEDRGVRMAALAAFQAVFMNDFATKNAEGKWALNPDLEPILRDLSTNEPDEEIRQKARHALGYDYTKMGEKRERQLRRGEGP